MSNANAKNANQSTHNPDPARLPKSVRGWAECKEVAILHDGDQLLVAVPVVGHGSAWYYKLEVVTIRCDEDHFGVEDCNGDSWGWELFDCDYFVKLTGEKHD